MKDWENKKKYTSFILKTNRSHYIIILPFHQNQKAPGNDSNLQDRAIRWDVYHNSKMYGDVYHKSDHHLIKFHFNTT